MSLNLEWFDSLVLGHAQIDLDHERIGAEHVKVGVMIELLGVDQQTFTAIGNLLDMTKRHFETEEGLMKRHRYQHTSQHVKEHASYIRLLTELLNREKSESFIIVAETCLTSSKSWFYHHIMTFDRPLCTFLAQATIGK